MQSRVEIIDQAIRDEFRRLVSLGRSPRGALADIGRYGVSSTRLRFRAQKDPNNRRWTPSKRVLLGGGQTLRLTSRLRNSITFNTSASGVEWGTNVKYGAIQQLGFYGAVRIGAHTRRLKKRQKYQVFKAGKDGKKRLSTRTETVAGNRFSVAAHTRIMRMPRREFLGVNSADKQAILKLLADHLRAVP